jgi:hypothetical protein
LPVLEEQKEKKDNTKTKMIILIVKHQNIVMNLILIHMDHTLVLDILIQIVIQIVTLQIILATLAIQVTQTIQMTQRNYHHIAMIQKRKWNIQDHQKMNSQD